ncbi:hypothetical protein FD723_39720 (plasmid) [Nostoc sp. C052]|uniref:hypothetical protein n=1 Tax=Nostoc sp. C052 TaxID=2576902 RepID=UPI0015C35A57|nr:hypothetical protein [Nostoc sp. C052]QLE46341.1 hypothetical protein FD723_39720 [Nostoc sp. C052]
MPENTPTFLISFTPSCDNCGSTENLGVDEIICDLCKSKKPKLPFKQASMKIEVFCAYDPHSQVRPSSRNATHQNTYQVEGKDDAECYKEASRKFWEEFGIEANITIADFEMGE